MKSTLLGLCANDTFCLVSRGGACCCRQFLRNVSDYCLAGGIFEVGMQSYLLETTGCSLLTCPTSNILLFVTSLEVKMILNVVTILQSAMNAKLSQQRFCSYYENRRLPIARTFSLKTFPFLWNKA